MFKDEKLDLQSKSSCLERFVGGIQASLVSNVQGLDPKKNCQPFIGLVRVKECISRILGIQGIQHACPNKVRALVSGKYKNNI